MWRDGISVIFHIIILLMYTSRSYLLRQTFMKSELIYSFHLQLFEQLFTSKIFSFNEKFLQLL